MKDNLILEGKIYISAKRAATLTGYTTDYVGQLCRAGKLDCKMIGRSWHVEQASLFRHKLDPSSAKSGDTSMAVTASETSVGSTTGTSVRASAESDISASSVASPYVAATDKAAADKKVSGFDFNSVYNLNSMAVAPAIKTMAPASAKAAAKSAAKISVNATSAEATAPRPISRYTKMPAKKSYMGRKIAIIALSTLVVIVAINVFSHPFGSFNGLAILSNRGANGSDGMNGANSSMLSSAGQSGLNGIAVAPSTNTIEGDEALKNQIRDSFTDQVNVSPDKNGTAGVITPVFKKASDGSYVYVLVPVKDANNVNIDTDNNSNVEQLYKLGTARIMR